MLVIPSIDIKNGQCVRLKQGLLEETTVFSTEPVAVAERWLNQGAKRLHLVDLDGAFSGNPSNRVAVKAIIDVIGNKIPIQLGGGIRNLDTIEWYLDNGISEVIIGTAAVNTPGFLHEACYAFPGQIIVSLDARDGRVAIDGWSKLTQHHVIDLAKKFENYGVNAIVYTDIGRDGMLVGINVEATAELAQNLTVPVMASGGLASLQDVTKLSEMAYTGISGVIAGRAIYDGTLDFSALLKLAEADQ